MKRIIWKQRDWTNIISSFSISLILIGLWIVGYFSFYPIFNLVQFSWYNPTNIIGGALLLSFVIVLNMMVIGLIVAIIETVKWIWPKKVI